MKIYKLSSLYKTIGSVLTILTSVFTFSSCSDDLDLKGAGIQGLGDGYLYVDFNVQDLSYVPTRSLDNTSEQKINNLTLLIFSSDGNTLLQREEVPEEHIIGINNASATENRKYTDYYISLNNSVGSAGKVYAIANNKYTTSDLIGEFTVGSGKKESDLKKITHNAHYTENNGANGWLMSDCTDITSTNTISISLQRTTAKITLKDNSSKAEDSDSKAFTLTGFTAKNTASSCYLVAGTMQAPEYFYTESTTRDVDAGRVEDSDKSFRYDAYVLPTKTHNDKDISSFVLIKGDYKGLTNYYAVALYKKDEDGTETYFDIEPNHWYEMVIKEIKGPGYIDPEEAAQNILTDQVVFEIHDHAPLVLSMMSDGVHELGVTPEVTIHATDTDGSTTFIVKCYSVYEDETFNPKDLEVVMTDGGDWLELHGEPVDVTPDNEVGDNDTPGTQLQYTVKTTRNIYSDRKAVLKVTWKGLERKVTVTYDSSIPTSSLCPISLIIHDKDTNKDYTIDDFWTFIEGKGKNYTSNAGADTPALFGINNLSNDHVRNNGLHFPMPYGKELNTPWEYEYILDFSNAEGYTFDNEKSVDTQNVEIENDYFKGLTIESKDKGKVSVKMTGSKNYDYETGSITFSVPIKEKDEARNIWVALNLYHTGFFHYANDSKYGFIGTDAGYYYYEVVPMGFDENLQQIYWLDRNLGAKSNMSYVRNEGEDYNGEKDAAGKYLSIANVVEYTTPSIDYNMCPPGYTIPSTSEWNVLRLSSNFITQRRTIGNSTYMATFFDTYDEKIGEIYFPKARYNNDPNSNIDKDSPKYADDPNAGDPSSGYYWTTTEAPGMEKENMGNWLRSIYFNGSSTNFNNSSVRDFKLPLRCIANNRTVTQVTNHYLSFNVHNVTHVFLFSYEKIGDEEYINQLYTFPGKSVGTEASSKVWQNFACITSADLSKVYAVFVKVDKDGKPTIFYKNGNTFTSNEKFNTNLLNPENAWQVQQGHYYDFCSGAGKPNVYESEEDLPNTCRGNDPLDPTKFNAGDIVKFKWRNSYNKVTYNRILAFYSPTEGENYFFAPTDGENWYGNTVPDDGEWFTFTSDRIDFKAPYMSIRLSDDSGEKYMDFSVSQQSGNFVVSGPAGGGSVTRIDKDDYYEWEITIFSQTEHGHADPDTFKEFFWEGYEQLNSWSDNFQELGSSKYDWSKVPENAWLNIVMDVRDDTNIQFKHLANGWGNIPTIKESYNKSDTSNGILNIQLTCTILDDLINNEGLVIYGINYTLKKITISMDKLTDNTTGGDSGNETPSFEPEDKAKEEIIWSGNMSLSGWGSNKLTINNNYVNWGDYASGTILKIYASERGEGYKGAYVDNGKWNDITDPDQIKDHKNISGIKVVECTLTKENIDMFIKNNEGLVIYGNNAVIIGVTLIPGDGSGGNQGGGNEGGEEGGGENPNPPTPPEIKDGDFEWTGSENINWNPISVGLTNEEYDWSQVEANSTLYVYYTYEENGQPQIFIRSKEHPDENDELIPGVDRKYSIWDNNLTVPIKIILSQDAINMIKQNGGVVFAGGNYTLTQVILTMATPSE